MTTTRKKVAFASFLVLAAIATSAVAEVTILSHTIESYNYPGRYLAHENSMALLKTPFVSPNQRLGIAVKSCYSIKNWVTESLELASKAGQQNCFDVPYEQRLLLRMDLVIHRSETCLCSPGTDS